MQRLFTLQLSAAVTFPVTLHVAFRTKTDDTRVGGRDVISPVF